MPECTIKPPKASSSDKIALPADNDKCPTPGSVPIFLFVKITAVYAKNEKVAEPEADDQESLVHFMACIFHAWLDILEATYKDYCINELEAWKEWMGIIALRFREVHQY